MTHPESAFWKKSTLEAENLLAGARVVGGREEGRSTPDLRGMLAVADVEGNGSILIVLCENQ